MTVIDITYKGPKLRCKQFHNSTIKKKFDMGYNQSEEISIILLNHQIIILQGIEDFKFVCRINRCIFSNCHLENKRSKYNLF